MLSVYKEAILECRNDSDSYMLVQAIGPITFNASGSWRRWRISRTQGVRRASVERLSMRRG